MRARSIPHLAVVAVALVASSAMARAQDACSQFKWPVSRERQAFGGALPIVQSGAQYPDMLSGVTVALDPQSAVSNPHPPARAPKSNPAYGAVISAPPVAAAGSYQVTVSEDVWIDLVQNGARLHSTAFSGKTGCPGVRKSVRFQLEPGALTLEISDSAVQRVNLDLLPVE